MKEYIIIYDDFKYGLCSHKYEASDIFEAINQFEFEENDTNNIISITVRG